MCVNFPARLPAKQYGKEGFATACIVQSDLGRIAQNMSDVVIHAFEAAPLDLIHMPLLDLDTAKTVPVRLGEVMLTPDRTMGHAGKPSTPLGNRLHVLAYSIETRIVRIISLRKANKREVSLYVSQG